MSGNEEICFVKEKIFNIDMGDASVGAINLVQRKDVPWPPVFEGIESPVLSLVSRFLLAGAFAFGQQIYVFLFL